MPPNKFQHLGINEATAKIEVVLYDREGNFVTGAAGLLIIPPGKVTPLEAAIRKQANMTEVLALIMKSGE